jgi:predicted phosphoribosyltransferase
MLFHDRREAGRALARALREHPGIEDALVLALPRGGVPVAYEVARELHLPLDVFVVRKLGVPGEEELAMGALASGGLVVLNPGVVRACHVSQAAVDAAVARQQPEIDRREALYRAGEPPLPVAGRTLILVDDGLATGSTIRAAVRALHPLAGRVVVAVPVAAPATCEELRAEVDEVVCLREPENFMAVGQFYELFEQTTDDEVRALLLAARQQDGSPRAA